MNRGTYKHRQANRSSKWLDRRGVSAIVITMIAGVAAASAAAQEDIVLHAPDFTVLEGHWSRVGSDTRSGAELASPDDGWSDTSAPASHPANYVEATFDAQAWTSYRVWVRLRAANNSKWNDSIWMQFSDAVDGNGDPAHRIGTTDGLLFNLEGCFECGVSGWGWSGGSWWSSESQHVQFASSGRQTIRVQTREDGVQIDQIVLSASTYLHDRPGQAQNDGGSAPDWPANGDGQNSGAGEPVPEVPAWVAPPEPAETPAPPAVDTGGGGGLRVMTWNIHFGHGDTWGQARAIADSGADVVLLQEAQTWDEHMPTTYPQRLAQLTGQYWHSLWSENDNPDCAGGCQGTLILSRFPIVDSAANRVSGTTATRALIDVHGVRINVFNIHLEYYDTSKRSSQLHEFMDWARQFGGPRLAGGDFNSWWGEYWIHQMETEYSDTWQDVTGSDEDGYTLNGAVRFDYLFRAYQENERLTPIWGEVRYTGLSDHAPFVAHFTVR